MTVISWLKTLLPTTVEYKQRMEETDSIDTNDNGVGFENAICYNDHGQCGQVMELVMDIDDIDGSRWVCPTCDRQAQFTIEYSDDGL